MSLAPVFNTLGQSVMPMIAATAFPDLCTIKRETYTQDEGGGVIETVTDYRTGVPCKYEPSTRATQTRSAGDRSISIQDYIVTLGTHLDGTRINLDAETDKIEVQARGNEPAKVFKITNIRDKSGVVFEAVCELEG